MLAPSSGKSARGFTMVELVIVMGVMAIILAGIWALVAVLYERAREHQANIQAQTIVGNIRQLYSRVGALTKSNYNYALDLDQQNALPPEMKINPSLKDGKINHPWSSSKNGSLLITGGFFDQNGEETLMSLNYISLPKKACVYMAMHLPETIMSGVYNIQINGSNCFGTSCSQPLPLSLTTATTACNIGNSGVSGAGQNSVLFLISIH